MMQLQINGDRGKTVWLQKPTYLIGQSAACNIRLADESLQPVHACLKIEGNTVKLLRQDDAQINVNGNPLGEEALLSPGDSIALGSTHLTLVDVNEADAPEAAEKAEIQDDEPEAGTQSAASEQQPEDESVSTGAAGAARQEAGEGWVIRGMSAALGGRTYLVKGKATIGRARDCDIQLGEAHLSRHHAQLSPAADGLQLEDLDSANGTFVNGRRIMQATLKNGDEVSFDTLKFRVFHTTDVQRDAQTTVRSTTPGFQPPRRNPEVPTAIEIQNATLRRMREERGQSASGGASARRDGHSHGGWIAATLAVIALAGVLWGAMRFFQPPFMGG